MRRDRHGAGQSLHLDDLGGGRDLARRRRLRAGRAIHDRDEVLLGGERDHDLEQEAVQLRLGEGIRPFHLERVLGGEDEERRVQLVALARRR